MKTRGITLEEYFIINLLIEQGRAKKAKRKLRKIIKNHDTKD